MSGKFKPQSRRQLVFLVLAGIVAVQLVVLGMQREALFSSAPPSFQAHVQEVLAACADAKYRPGCYDEEIPKLTGMLSMEEAFEVTRAVQGEDPSYQYCHVLGHSLSAIEVAKDPEQWKDVVTRCPSGLCSNGCIHGGFQERFREGSFTDEEIVLITQDLQNLCEPREGWRPTGLEQGSCYHALGHLTMYLTEADLPKALDICDEVAVKQSGRDWSPLCYDGAFMQIFQPLEPEDFALIEGKVPTKEEIPAYCGAYEGRQRASCLSESWPLFNDQLQDPAGLVAFCDMTGEEYRPRCFNALFYVLTAQFGFDEERIASFCTGLPAHLQGKCFANGASRMIETDWRNIGKAVHLCQAGSTSGNEGPCFAELLQYSTYNFHAGSPEFFELCNQLPEQWKHECLAKA